MGGSGVNGLAVAADSHTWGISGSDFIRIYLAAVALAVVVALVMRSRVWRWQERRPVQRPADGTDLAAVELAYLTGDADHVTLVSCLRLAEAGAVEMPENAYGYRPPEELGDGSRAAEVRLTGGAPIGRLHPIESAALRHLQAGRTGSVLQAALREGPEMQALHQDMMASGFLVDGALARRLRLSGLALGAVVVLGLARLAVGLGNGRPVGFLVLALIVAAVALILSLRAPRLTRAGTRTTESLTARYYEVARPLMKGSNRPVPGNARAGSGPDAPATGQNVDSWAIAALGAGAMWGLAPGAAAYFGFAPQIPSGSGTASTCGGDSGGGCGGDSGGGCGGGCGGCGG